MDINYSINDIIFYLFILSLIDDKTLYTNGELNQDLKSIQNIQYIPIQKETKENNFLLYDLLWIDLDKDAIEYDKNDRGVFM